MKFFLFITLVFFAFAVKAQKIYVWCPENNQVKPRNGLKQNDTIKVVFFDGRSIPPKNKIECSSEQVIQTLFLQLKSAYPSAILVMQPEAEYYKKNRDAKSTLIKIGIAAYHAGFGTDISGGIGMVGGHFSSMVFPKGQWNAITAYYIQVFIGDKSTTKEISNVASKSNMWGYKSARNALNECYNTSTNELLFFLDEQFSN
ncbi:MAG: hypothetical protein JSU01_20335 [Bacteroidetes bacterium]|nr:hypothetical protein [Bacteroidota bacterium]